ncbi:bacteriorhodopsin [Sphingomonas bacterium]|uniref:bacteriorhodopsin n=1 Tax=Sphingomonas bacterium TaxID=1895847 RepID=UPI001574F74F|nr:bacteriorhodopsin [Sphingomonas bacterium]
MDSTPLLIGFVIMSLASLAIFAVGSKLPSVREHTYYHSIVPFIAATSYLAMTFGIGDFFKLDGTVTLTARYIDWSITTPILLTGLVVTALFGRKSDPGFLVSVITLDVLMIVAGLISSMSTLPAMKLVWFAWSCAAFLGVLYILWGPLRAISRSEGGAMDGAYAKNLVFLTVVWILYPVVFAIGPEGVHAITPLATIWAILVLDVVAKVVYAFYVAANIDKAMKSMVAPESYRA